MAFSYYSSLTIYCYEGSYAQSRLDEIGISYKIIDNNTKKEITASNVSIVNKNYTYTGKAIKPTVTVKDSKGNVISATNYTVACKNNTNAGTATVTVTMKGNYKGTVTKTFKINQAANSITVPKTAYTKTASASAVQYISLGAKAKGGTITYTSSDKKVVVSKAGRVTIPKNFAGKVTVTITAKNNNYKTVTKKVVITVKPAKEKITSVANTAKGVLTVKWTKFAYANGYELQYSTRSNFAGAKKLVITSPTTINKAITGLKKGITYYVRVRAYKSVGSSKIYGVMSDVKKFKVTK